MDDIPVDSTENKYELTPTKTWREYLERRIKTSNLCTCWYYNDMDIIDSDAIVNSVTVVNALLLTIPFALIGAYNASFWEWEMNNLASCNGGTYNTTTQVFSPSQLNQDGFHIYSFVTSNVLNCAFSSSIGLILATIYYTLRPRNQSIFIQWWPRGKYSIFFILVFTAVAIFCLLSLFGMSVSLLLSSDQYTCHAMPSLIKNNKHWQIAMIIILIFSGVLPF